MKKAIWRSGVVTRFHPRIAPIKVPCSRCSKISPDLVNKAKEVRDLLLRTCRCSMTTRARLAVVIAVRMSPARASASP